MGRRKAKDGGSEAAGDGTEGLKPKRRFTPEERRRTVEAWRKSGLTQKAFARQWGVSHMTLWAWARKYALDGPQGLERMGPGPAKRRGKAPLPEAVKAEIVATRRQFPTFGLKKIRDWLKRFGGLRVSRSSVKRVVDAAGLERAPAPKRRRRASPPRRFQRALPGLLWQTDITYLHVPWQRGPLYLIVFLDDCSRYVVGHGLYTHQRHEIALETFQEACARFGKPKEVLSDQGRQYFAWRGKSEFEKLLEREGVKHVVARAQHPETVGKCERFWETLKRELWDRVHPRDLEEARERVKLFIAHHNHHRPHQGLDGGIPADRFFGVESEVRKALEATLEKNALRLALGEAPRKPVFLVGQIDGQAVSLHGESGRVVVTTPQGVQEIQTKDLGLSPRKEASDERKDEGHDDDDQLGGQAAGDPGRGPGGGGGAGAAAAAADGPQAHAVPGAGEDAGAGAGAVDVGERGGAAAGASDGGGGAPDVAGKAAP
jgi:transposase InsO family protein